MCNSILVLDTDEHFATAITRRMTAHGIEVHRRTNPRDATELTTESGVDAALVSLSLFGEAAFETLRLVRNSCPRCAVFACSEGASGVEAVLCLQAGADDYYSKSDDLTLLEAKVLRALRRQSEFSTTPQADAAPRASGVHRLPPMCRPIIEESLLTRFEERLLNALCCTPGQSVKASTLVAEIWKRVEVDPKLLYEHVSRLRAKLEPIGWTIVNTRGEGYRVQRRRQDCVIRRRA